MNKRRLNVLYIAHEGHMGGATRSLATLAKLIQERGHNVTVALPFKNSEIRNELKKNDVETIVQFYTWCQYPENEGEFVKRIYQLGYWLNIFFEKKLYRKIRKRQFDIVHTNSSVVDIGIDLSHQLKAKHVWHFREFGEEDLGTKYVRGKEKSMNMINQTVDKVIFISEAMEKHYADWIGAEKRQVIYNGIGNEYLYEKEGREDKEKVVFLISGALQRGKGQACAIKAVSILKSQGYDRFKMVIAGRNIANYENILREMVKEEEVEEFIEFRGFVEDMRTLRRECDVELVCSLKEAFGRVSVEAMMSSNPVIATKSGANPELIQNEENGFLFEVENPKELAECMAKFLENPQLIVQMGKTAFERAKKTYTAEKNAVEIENLYYQILERKQ